MAHGSTRLHFPIREATKDKQLDSQIPHIPSIWIAYTQYAWYVQIQHGITTWLYNSSTLFKSLKSIHNIHTDTGHTTQHSSHTIIQANSGSNLSEYRHLENKRGLRKPGYPTRSIVCSGSPPGLQPTHRSPSGTTSETDVSPAKHK